MLPMQAATMSALAFILFLAKAIALGETESNPEPIVRPAFHESAGTGVIVLFLLRISSKQA